MLHEVAGSETALLVMLFPQLAGLDVLGVEDLGADGVRVTARTRPAPAACPRCGQASSSGHDRYPRWLRDLPCGGRPVEVLVSVRRLRCANAECPAATFAEQVPGLTAWYQRRTPGLRGLLEAAGLALAGRAGARLAAALGAAVSRHTLIRMVRAMPDPGPGQVAVLGADDVATRKGQHYATILVNMETHQVIDLLPGRDGDVLAGWLKDHPGTAVICRDRAGAYAGGAARGAPGALQVADRWHLWHNLCGHAEKTAARHRGCLREPGPGEPQAAAGQGPADPALARDVRERYGKVRELHAQGHGIAAIARHAALPRETVRAYVNAGSPDEILSVITGSRPSPLDPYKPRLGQRWEEGCRDATALLTEIRALGYRGSYRVLSAYLRPFRKAGTLPPAAPVPPKARDIARWILTSPDNLDDDGKRELARARSRCPHLDALARHVAEFAKILTGLHGDRLDDWLAAVENDDQPDLRSFARGIRRDYDAVRNGLTLPYSSGAVEGKNCKFKHIKRIMYGRANFDLLRKMIILN
ncbi:MAG: ISL3 family transposase [Trebonia sp.]